METPIKNLFADEINLTHDSDTATRLRDEISDWSNAIPHHPFTNFGEQIHIKQIVFRPAYRFLLHVQYEKRSVKEKYRPFWGEELPTARITRPESVKASEMDMPIPPGFSTNEHSHDVWDSERAIDCKTCTAKGTLTCHNCKGEGQFTCLDCSGDGSCQCQNCSGSGNITNTISYTRKADSGTSKTGKQTIYETVREKCKVCRGIGKISCSKCSGHGHEICKICESKGTLECPTCRGTRKVVAWFSVQQQLTSFRLQELMHNTALLNDEIWQDFNPPDYEIRKDPVFTRTENRLPVSLELLLSGSKDSEGQTDEPAFEQSPDTAEPNRTWHTLKTEAKRKMHDDGSRIIREQLTISQLDVYHVTYSFQDETFELLVYGRSNEIHAPKNPLQRVHDNFLEKGNELLSNRDLVLAGDYLNLVREMNQVNYADRTAGEITSKIEEASELTLKDYKTGFWIGALVCMPIVAWLLFGLVQGPGFLMPELNEFAQSRYWIQSVHPWAVSFTYLLLGIVLAQRSVTHFFEDIYKTLRTHSRAGRIFLGTIPAATESAMFGLVFALLDLSGLSLLLDFAAYPVYLIGGWIL